MKLKHKILSFIDLLLFFSITFSLKAHSQAYSQDQNNGLKLMKKVVENHAQNNPEKYNSYRYTGLQNFSLSSCLKNENINDTNKSIDALSDSLIQKTASRPFFSLEILSQKKMLQPDHMNESLISAKYTGTARKAYLALANELNDLSVYDPYFTVLNESWFSPVSQSGLKKYFYDVTDTLKNGKNDSTFVIHFYPRKQKSHNSLTGEIFINKHGFAVQSFTAVFESDDPALPSVSVSEKFDCPREDKWFPLEKKATVRFTPKNRNPKDSLLWKTQVPFNQVIAVNRTFFYQREVNPPLKPSDFTKNEVTLSPELNKPLNETVPLESSGSYLKSFSDSAREAGFQDNRSKLIRFIAEGKIPMGYFNLRYNNFFSYNLYEGIRLGVGAETNRRLSRYFALGGYITYGLKDKMVHHGEWMDIYPKGYFDFRFHFGFRDMNTEFGEPEFLEKRSLLNPEYFRYLLIKNMFSTRRYTAGIEVRPIQTLNTYLFGDLSDNSARTNNIFLSQHTFSPFRMARVGLRLRYSPGTSFIRDPDMMIENTPPKSDWFLNFTQGLGIFGGEYRYTKAEFKGKIQLKPYPKAVTSVMLRAGYITDRAPLTELFNGYGSYVNTFSLVAPNSFNTMRQNEFGADIFTAIHLRHDFGALMFPEDAKFNPQFVIAENIGFGRLNEFHSSTFGLTDFRKGYYESGFEINNILRMDFLSWGIGIYYRYGPYRLPVNCDNFAYKFGFYFKL